VVTKLRPKLTQTISSTIALILLLDLFVVAWLALLYVTSQMFPDPEIRQMLSEIWRGKADIVAAFLGIGAALIVYLKLKQAFNPILWAPIIMTGSVVVSGFSAGYLTPFTQDIGLSATLSQLGIILALVVGVGLMMVGVKLYRKCQCGIG